MFWHDLVDLKSEPKGYIWSGVARPFTHKHLSIRDYEHHATRVCLVWNRSQLKKSLDQKFSLVVIMSVAEYLDPHNIWTPGSINFCNIWTPSKYFILQYNAIIQTYNWVQLTWINIARKEQIEKEHSNLKLLKESYFSKNEWKAESHYHHSDPKEEKHIVEMCMSLQCYFRAFGITKTSKMLTERFYWRRIQHKLIHNYVF